MAKNLEVSEIMSIFAPGIFINDYAYASNSNRQENQSAAEGKDGSSTERLGAADRGREESPR